MDEMKKLRAVHPFPARMASSIALDALVNTGEKSLKVLDPMSGSGTSLVVARFFGHKAYGFDSDPLAQIISGTWTSNIDEEKIRNLTVKIIADAKKNSKRMKLSSAYPSNADEETKKFIRFWFNFTSRRQLRALATEIEKITNKNLKRIMWCAFSRLIIAKEKGASYARDLSHSRPHRVLDKNCIKPLYEFNEAVEVIIKNNPFKNEKTNLPLAQITPGDAREIPLPDNYIDLVITSPPYLNAIDYIRCSKFSLVWMGHPISKLRGVRTKNIGTEAAGSFTNIPKHIRKIMLVMGDIDKLPARYQRMIAQYVSDMSKVIKEIKRVLVRGGKCVLVIGDSTLLGIFLKNSQALIKLGALHGLSLEQVTTRKLLTNHRYLPPPTSKKAGGALQARMGEELVITFTSA